MDKELKNQTDPEAPEAESQMVQVPKSFLKDVADILKRQKENDKEMALLRQAVDRNKLLEAENKSKPKELPRAYMKVFMGKLVTGWKTEKSELIYNPANPNAPVGEVLKGRYFFADGNDSGVQDQVLFTREENRLVVSIIDEIRDPQTREVISVKVKPEYLETNDEELKKTFEMPREPFDIRIHFLNP